MYAYIAGSPFVFMQKFGFTDAAFGWAFALNACGLIAGSQLNHIALKRYSSPSIVRFNSLCLVLTTLCLVLLTLFGIAGPVTTLGFIFFSCSGSDLSTPMPPHWLLLRLQHRRAEPPHCLAVYKWLLGLWLPGWSAILIMERYLQCRSSCLDVVWSVSYYTN